MLHNDIFTILMFLGVMNVFWEATEMAEVVDWCESREKTSLLPEIQELVDGIENESEIFRGEACYFHVRNAEKTSSRGGAIEMPLARNICAQYFSTLPTLRDTEEADFLKQFNQKFKTSRGRPQDRVLLGLELALDPNAKHSGLKLAKIQEWDDKIEPIYDDFSWFGAHSQNLEDNPRAVWDPKERGIRLFREDILDAVAVHCKQNVTGGLVNVVNWCKSRAKTNLPPQIQKLVDDIENESEVFRGEACYFHVRDAEKKSSSAESIIQVPLARNICAQYSSTLPTLRDMEEADFLSQFNTKIIWSGPLPYVLLGLELALDPNDKALTKKQTKIQEWDDQIEPVAVNFTWLPIHHKDTLENNPRAVWDTKQHGIKLLAENILFFTAVHCKQNVTTLRKRSVSTSLAPIGSTVAGNGSAVITSTTSQFRSNSTTRSSTVAAATTLVTDSNIQQQPVSKATRTFSEAGNFKIAIAALIYKMFF